MKIRVAFPESVQIHLKQSVTYVIFVNILKEIRIKDKVETKSCVSLSFLIYNYL